MFKSKRSDPVAEQLRQVERQGAGMAMMAHGIAFALVLVFSAGSLVALAGEAFAHFLEQWRGGTLDIPSAISFVVSLILVIAMDYALLVAAQTVNILRQRRQKGAGWHMLVIGWVSAVEAATYLYMSVRYDHPVTVAVWLLLIVRAITAPGAAVYLSLTRTLPLGARDIFYQVELATGRGVIRDMIAIAGDPDAEMRRKLALFGAASVMAPDDRTKLDQLMLAETETRPSPQQSALPPAAIAESLPGNWDGPDDDGPGGGVDSTDDQWDTSEWPAISGLMNGHRPHNSPVGYAGRGDDHDQLEPAPVGRKTQLNATEKRILKRGKEGERMDIIREMQADDPDVTVYAIRQRLKDEGLGTNDREVRRLQGLLQRSNRMRVVGAAQ